MSQQQSSTLDKSKAIEMFDLKHIKTTRSNLTNADKCLDHFKALQTDLCKVNKWNNICMSLSDDIFDELKFAQKKYHEYKGININLNDSTDDVKKELEKETIEDNNNEKANVSKITEYDDSLVNPDEDVDVPEIKEKETAKKKVVKKTTSVKKSLITDATKTDDAVAVVKKKTTTKKVKKEETNDE